MVYKEWGDWRPEAEWVWTPFGRAQINPNHWVAWGNLAPPRNRRYKNGPDIRPLGPTGLQNQRYASLLLQEEEAKEIGEHVKSVRNEALREFQHVSGLLSRTDPLYLLYYRQMLEDLMYFDTRSANPRDWGFDNAPAWERAQRYGMLKNAAKKIEELQDRYDLALSADMPRGKRILMYHDILREWRRQERYMDHLNQQGKYQIKAEARLERIREMKRNGKITRERRDAEIFADVVLGKY